VLFTDNQPNETPSDEKCNRSRGKRKRIEMFEQKVNEVSAKLCKSKL